MTPQITWELYTQYIKGDNHRANINIPQNRITWLPTKGGTRGDPVPRRIDPLCIFCEAPHAHCEPPAEWDVFGHCGSQWRKITGTMRPAPIISQIMMRERLLGFYGCGFRCFSIDFYVWMAVRLSFIRVIRYFMNYASGEDTIPHFFLHTSETAFGLLGDIRKGKEDLWCSLGT